jgi:hypothetical protein
MGEVPIQGELPPGSSFSRPSLSTLEQGLETAWSKANAASRKQSKAHVAALNRFSLQPLSALKQMTIKDLKGGVVHLGRYILLRVPYEPSRLRGASAIAQDVNGDHICLNLRGAALDGEEAALPHLSMLAVKVHQYTCSVPMGDQLQPVLL